MGEARTALLEGTEAGARGSIIRAAGVGVKDRQRSIQRTAVYGPVCTVVWEGRSREAPPIPIAGSSLAIWVVRPHARDSANPASSANLDPRIVYSRRMVHSDYAGY